MVIENAPSVAPSMASAVRAESEIPLDKAVPVGTGSVCVYSSVHTKVHASSSVFVSVPFTVSVPWKTITVLPSSCASLLVTVNTETRSPAFMVLGSKLALDISGALVGAGVSVASSEAEGELLS